MPRSLPRQSSRSRSSRAPRVDPARVHAVALAVWLSSVVALALVWAFPRFFGALLLMALSIVFYGVVYAVVEQRMMRMERESPDELGRVLDDLGVADEDDFDGEADEEEDEDLPPPPRRPAAKRPSRRRRAASAAPEAPLAAESPAAPAPSAPASAEVTEPRPPGEAPAAEATAAPPPAGGLPE